MTRPRTRETAGPVAGHSAEPASAISRRPAWERTYGAVFPVLDAVLASLAAFAAFRLRYPAGTVATLGGLPYAAVIAVMGPAWVLTLAGSHVYELRAVGDGGDEYKRVLVGTWRFAALLAITSYAFKAQLTRGFFLISLPLGTSLLLVARVCTRQLLLRRRRQGSGAVRRILVVGPPHLAEELVREITTRPLSSFVVAGQLAPGLELSDVLDAIAAKEADTVAVVGSSELPKGFVRRLAWMLEGTAVDLMVAPAITDVAGPRIHVRPVAGLSLLYLDAPTFTGATRLVKTTFDLVLGTILAVLALPLLAVLYVAIRLDSPGPPLFRQTRLGQHGREFRVWKLRTMHAGAEHRRKALSNEASGQLFKVRRDPRVTRVGALLRRFSVDELPQLWNVLAGQMSLVGPRPLPATLDEFAHDERRRMLVKPGMTGLWQVSGRSDLDWDETVRLDLYYVENWSLALDVVILVRTVAAVLRGRGAY